MKINAVMKHRTPAPRRPPMARELGRGSDAQVRLRSYADVFVLEIFRKRTMSSIGVAFTGFWIAKNQKQIIHTVSNCMLKLCFFYGFGQYYKDILFGFFFRDFRPTRAFFTDMETSPLLMASWKCLYILGTHGHWTHYRPHATQTRQPMCHVMWLMFWSSNTDKINAAAYLKKSTFFSM